MPEDESPDIMEDRAEVAEDATPETDLQATEQRTDDYDAIMRRMTDLEDMLRDRLDTMQRMLETLGIAAVESTNVTDGDFSDIGETAADAVDAILGIDSLDLL